MTKYRATIFFCFFGLIINHIVNAYPEYVPSLRVARIINQLKDQLVLRVAVSNFSPPFVMRTAKNHFYGFDIGMMDAICKELGRHCEYIVMPFDSLISTVALNNADVTVSNITITKERLHFVRFSQPYLQSESRFLTQTRNSNQTFDFHLLTNKKIGVEQGTIFAVQLAEMKIDHPKIMTFKQTTDLIDALNQGKVDFILMDNAEATYWKNQSSGALATIGEPFNFGVGYGIGISPQRTDLPALIDKALTIYMKSEGYKQNMQMYLANI